MTDETIFYQFAAGLIPALLFGGLLAERLKPPDGPSSDTKRFVGTLAVTGGTSAALFAEFLAIDAIISGEGNGFSRAYVSITIAAATAAIAYVLMVPWLKWMLGDGRWEQRVARSGGIAIVVACAFTGVSTWRGAFEFQDSKGALAESQADLRRAQRNLASSNRDLEKSRDELAETRAYGIRRSRTERELLRITARLNSLPPGQDRRLARRELQFLLRDRGLLDQELQDLTQDAIQRQRELERDMP